MNAEIKRISGLTGDIPKTINEMHLVLATRDFIQAQRDPNMPLHELVRRQERLWRAREAVDIERWREEQRSK